MRVVYFPYEKKTGNTSDFYNIEVFQFFYHYLYKAKYDNSLSEKLPRELLKTLQCGDIYDFNEPENTERYCVLVENDNGEYLGHVFIWFIDDILYMQGIQTCIINLIRKFSKDERYVPNIHKYLVESIINIAKERNCKKIIVVDALVHMQKLLFKYDFYPRCYCKRSFMYMDNRDCDDECQENKFDYFTTRCCHRNINQNETFEIKAEYLEEYLPKRIDDESFYECINSEGKKFNMKDSTLKYYSWTTQKLMEFKIEKV